MLDAIAKPFGILLMWLYEFAQSYGLAIILFALVVKLIMLPFQMKSKRGSMQTTRLQPKIQELQKRHGANQQKLNEEMQKLYKEEGINPMSGCLWGLLPFPIMIALYQAIRYPLTIMMGIGKELVQEGGAILTKLTELGFEQTVSDAYVQIQQAQFISQPENFNIFAEISDKLRQIDFNLFGLNLGAVPNWKFWTFDFSDSAIWVPQVLLFCIPLLAGGLALAQTLMMKKLQPAAPATADGQANTGAMSAMMYITPLMSLYFTFITPAALGLYWAASSLFQIIQEIILTKHYTKVMDREDEAKDGARRAREAEIERRREETERLKAENKTALNPSTSKKKQELAEKKEREAKAAEWAKKHAPPPEEKEEDPARVGNRKYARGRAYDPNRYGESGLVAEEKEDESEEYTSTDLPESSESVVDVPAEDTPETESE